jgi:hypothetical protein
VYSEQCTRTFLNDRSCFPYPHKKVLAAPSNGLPVIGPSINVLLLIFTRLALHVQLTSHCVSVLVASLRSVFHFLIYSNK